MNKLINLEKWRVLSEIKKQDLGGKLGLADHHASYQRIQKEGLIKTYTMDRLLKVSGMSYFQSLDRELFYKSFIFKHEERNTKVLGNLELNLTCAQIENAFDYKTFIDNTILTINCYETIVRNKFDYKKALEEQEVIYKEIKRALKLNKIVFKESYLSYTNYQYFRRF